MLVNTAAAFYSLSNLPFKESLSDFEYQGNCVSRKFSHLFKCNLSSLLAQLTKDLHHWSLLPLSLAGRINCIKNAYTSKIPIFSSFNGPQCIWNKKPPRIRKDTQQKPKEMGGPALPNFYDINGLSIFGLFCTGVPLAIRRCLPLTLSPSAYSGHSIVKNRLKIWTQLKSHFELQTIPPSPVL